jgi:LPXTG-site transpeptidase (sortase) family protein
VTELRPRLPFDAESIRGTTEAEVLQRFVASVRQWRGRSTAALQFRDDDLTVLAGMFGTDATNIERRLIALTGCDRRTAKRLRRLLLASLAAPIALTALTIVPSERTGDPAGRSAEAIRTTPAAAVVDLPTDSPTTSVSVVEPTTVPAPTPAPAPAPVAAAARVVVAAGSEATVSIARLGIELPVVAGGQDVIDQGVVAHYWAEGWRVPAAAGGVGTYWLAAHHATHGSPFALVPQMVVGDEIDVTTAGQTFTYTVTSTEVVEDDAGFGPVYGTDPAAKVILLQTCLDHFRRLLVHGTLTSVA